MFDRYVQSDIVATFILGKFDQNFIDGNIVDPALDAELRRAVQTFEQSLS